MSANARRHPPHAGAVEMLSRPAEEDVADVMVPRAGDGPPFQVMPPLSADEYAVLRADIAAHGVRVPVVVDQYGRTLDGHHRREIADGLGIAYREDVVHVADDDHARDIALELNVSRRHLTREQRRELIAAELARRPDDSDRAIARRLRVSPSTVGAVRTSAVSNLDTDEPMSAAEGRERIERVKAGLEVFDESLSWLLTHGYGVDALQLAAEAHGELMAQLGEEAARPITGRRLDAVRAALGMVA